jgi:hypothetical protein
MTIALRAFPELLGWPRIVWARVGQVHLGAATLATDADIWMVHDHILVPRPRSVQPGTLAGHRQQSTRR